MMLYEKINKFMAFCGENDIFLSVNVRSDNPNVFHVHCSYKENMVTIDSEGSTPVIWSIKQSIDTVLCCTSELQVRYRYEKFLDTMRETKEGSI